MHKIHTPVLVVGDCQAAKPSAQHATMAVCGFMGMETFLGTHATAETAVCGFIMIGSFLGRQTTA